MPSRQTPTAIDELLGNKIAQQLIDFGIWKTESDTSQVFLSVKTLKLLDSDLLEGFYNAEALRLITGNDDLVKIFNPSFLESSMHTDSIIEVKISFEKNSTKYHKFYQINIGKIEENQKTEHIGSIRDISRQKKNEEELNKAKEKIEESDKLKTVFLSNISHEIRTPMNSILGFVELMNMGGLDEEKRFEYLKIIKNKSKHLLSYIDDIIELNKLEFGEATINKSMTNVVKLLAEMYNEINNEKITKNKSAIDVFLNIPANSYDFSHVYVDSGRLQQVLKILLTNALSNTDKGYIQIGIELKDSKNILFYIKDTGNGYSKEEQKNIFNQLKIFDTNVKSKISCNLSLLIAKRIIENIGGKLHFESVQNEGSTFSITIPYIKQEKNIAEKNTENTSQRKYNWKDKLVLIAEDEDDNYKFLEAILDDTKVKLIHVYNGHQAVEIFKSIQHIDLILMDIRMPEMNGYDAIREIKRINASIPIIAQTAFALKEEQIKCLEAGCNDYLSKPIEIELLLNKMAQYLS